MFYTYKFYNFFFVKVTKNVSVTLHSYFRPDHLFRIFQNVQLTKNYKRNRSETNGN